MIVLFSNFLNILSIVCRKKRNLFLLLLLDSTSNKTFDSNTENDQLFDIFILLCFVLYV